ncbi:hypothetical protein EV06_1067 [Prochlorococcus sp. MIT 0602]|nr:hypothetical protein EV06_1067 [Prochlorococcus sp. MIT 0602]KGG17473.1 hypothetical protein EV07_0913 [Prochlorococcus sp. MIT 0603]
MIKVKTNTVCYIKKTCFILIKRKNVNALNAQIGKVENVNVADKSYP